MDISRNGILFIARREALCLNAYQDGQHMSIGFGSNDPKLRPGDTITIPEAFARLINDLKPRVFHVNELLKVDVAQNQFDALMSLYYQSQFRYAPLLIDLINDHKPDLAVNVWPYCDRSKAGEWMGGLHTRRQLEVKVFTVSDYGDLSKVGLYRGKAQGPPPEFYTIQGDEF